MKVADQVRCFARLLPFLGVLAVQIACGCEPLKDGSKPELVMSEGTKIEARGAGGSISVLAGSGFQRTYAWDKCLIVAHPCPRTERWYGSLGIFDPAPGLFYWHSCEGVSRPTVEENQLHFPTRDDAEAWLTRYVRVFPETTVYRNDGLVVQWRITPERAQLHADVLQICIDGHKPTILAGGSDGAITMVGRTKQPVSTRECTRVSPEVMAQTKQAFEGLWGSADMWRGTVSPESAHEP